MLTMLHVILGISVLQMQISEMEKNDRLNKLEIK